MPLGVVSLYFEDYYGLSRSESSLLPSLMFGSILVASPFCSWYLNRSNLMRIAVIGNIILSLGIFLCGFDYSNFIKIYIDDKDLVNKLNYYIICLFMGIIGAIGGSFLNLVSMISIPKVTRDGILPFMFGFVGSATGLGLYLFSKIWPWLFDTIGHHHGFKVLGIANFIILGIASIPFNFKSDIVEDEPNQTKSEEEQKLGNENMSDITDVDIKQKEFSYDKNQSYFQKILQILSDKTVLLLIASDFLNWSSQFVPYVHLDKLCLQADIDHTNSFIQNSTLTHTNLINSTTSTGTTNEIDTHTLDHNINHVSKGAVLISYLGLTSSLGKILFGFLCSNSCKFWKFTSLQSFMLAQILLGICIICMPIFNTNYSILMFITILAGTLSGNYALVAMFMKTIFCGSGNDNLIQNNRNKSTSISERDEEDSTMSSSKTSDNSEGQIEILIKSQDLQIKDIDTDYKTSSLSRSSPKPKPKGMAYYVDVTGVILLIEAIGIFLGPPLIGLLYDILKSYFYGFIVSGIMIIFSGLACLGLLKAEKIML
jgi:hypothetical protein